MDTKTIGYWNEKKEKLMINYPDIKEEDLTFHNGKEKEMIEMLGYKLGKTIEEMRIILATI